MKILAINTIKYNNNHEYHIQNTAEKAKQPIQSGVYNPIYYKDYNLQISFGKRSPEEFYAMDSNRENMPKVMKEYLNEKLAERSKLAPIQVMQEAYDDLSVASTVDDIRELFPQGREPKFDKLRPAVYSPSKVGILGKIGEIKAMQENPEPLFKDGSDDLTTYLVKKIYLEGKTVKEIDKDFARDINDVYELAARVPAETQKALGKNESAYFSHSTVYGLGIRFPEIPFWNSFISTRDDYERTTRIKTKHGFVNASDAGKTPAAHPTTKPEAPAKPRKYTFHPDRIKKLTDIIINTNEGSHKALKEVKRRGGRNEEEISFLQKYWSEIMTLATEKVHLSEEMIDFNATRKATQEKLDGTLIDRFVTGQEITKRQKTPLKIFWDERPDLKEHFSQSITDVIMQFTDAYGADGENSYFKALLADAHNIKPMRELARIRHEELQAEYDELGRRLMEATENRPKEPENIVEEVKATIAEITEAPQPEFKYIIDGQEITTTYDIKARTFEIIDEDLRLLPSKLLTKFRGVIDEITRENPERYYLSFTADRETADSTIRELLYDEETALEFNKATCNLMEEKYNAELESCRLAFVEVANKHNLLTDREINSFNTMDILNIQNFILDKLPEDADFSTIKAEIDQVYNRISKPLTDKEAIQIRTELMKYLENYKNVDTRGSTDCIPPMIKTLSLSLEIEDADYKTRIKHLLSEPKVLREQGPSMRYILDPNGNKVMQEIIKEHSLRALITQFREDCSLMMFARKKELDELLAYFPIALANVKHYAALALFSGKRF